MANFTQILQDLYESNPDRNCVYLQFSNQPDETISYTDLFHGATGYARSYSENGIRAGDVIVLILQHGKDLLYAYFGAILHGAIPSIMPFLTEKLLPDRYQRDLAALIKVTCPDCIVTFPDFEMDIRAALIPGDSVRVVLLNSQIHMPEKPLFKTFAGLYRNENDIVLLQHSSGTTGLQKGVALSHKAVLNQIESYSVRLR